MVSAPPVDTLPAFESREYCLFFQDFDALLIYLPIFFFAFKFGWVVNNTFFCGVRQTQNTHLIDFTLTLSSYNLFSKVLKLLPNVFLYAVLSIVNSLLQVSHIKQLK